MIRKISWKFDENPTWFQSGLNLGLGGRWGFLTGDLKDGVIFDNIDHACRWYGKYTESLMKIRHDYAGKKFIRGMGWGWVVFFVKFKDWFKPIKNVVLSKCHFEPMLVLANVVLSKWCFAQMLFWAMLFEQMLFWVNVVLSIFCFEHMPFWEY